MSVNWLLILAIVLAIILAGAAVILVWLVLGVSYTLTELLILLKDQHDARSDAAAKAIAIRTGRHNVIVTKLVSMVDHLQQLRVITSRIEVNATVPEQDRKAIIMKASPHTPAGADAPEHLPTMQAESGHGPVVLPEPPAASSDPTHDSQVATLCWNGPSSAGTLIGIGAVPAK